MYKILLYAGDAVFMLQDPVKSLRALHLILTQFDKVSSYKINEAKSTIVVLNKGPEMQDQIRVCVTQALKSKVKYLGINIEILFDKTTCID